MHRSAIRGFLSSEKSFPLKKKTFLLSSALKCHARGGQKDRQAGRRDSGLPARLSFVEAEPRKGPDLSIRPRKTSWKHFNV